MEENILTSTNETENQVDKKRKKFGIICVIVIFFIFIFLSIILSSETATYTLGSYKYKVPKQWRESKSSNHLSYYYTSNNDFLMVTSEVISKPLDEEEYENILSGMRYSTGMNNEISRGQLEINNILGFSSEVEGTYDDTDYIGYFATFQKDENVISLYLVDIKGDSDLKNKFEKIISSLKYEWIKNRPATNRATYAVLPIPRMIC